MDATERARLRALCEAATPGPWDAIYDEDAGEWMVRTGHADVAVLTWQRAIDALGLSPMTMRTAAFIAASRTAIPALLDDSERLDAAERERDETRAEVERLRAESEERLRTIQRVAEAVAAEPPMDLVARVRWQVAEVERLRHRLGRVIVAADQIPQHLGATWWGQRLRAALVPPATEVPDDRARGTGGAT